VHVVVECNGGFRGRSQIKSTYVTVRDAPVQVAQIRPELSQGVSNLGLEEAKAQDKGVLQVVEGLLRGVSGV
jgi:hypothetical protein